MLACTREVPKVDYIELGNGHKGHNPKVDWNSREAFDTMDRATGGLYLDALRKLYQPAVRQLMAEA